MPPALINTCSKFWKHGARAELLSVNAELNQAQAALARAREPVQRLQRCVADHDLAARDLEAAEATQRDIMGRWLAQDMPGPKPEPSRALVAAQARVDETARLASAARQALPTHEGVQAAAARLVAELSTRRDRAHILAAIEAAKAFVADDLVPVIAQFRATEAVLRNLEDALAIAGHHGAAEQIRAVIAAAKSGAPPKPDVASAQRWLQALLAQPADAQLGVP